CGREGDRSALPALPSKVNTGRHQSSTILGPASGKSTGDERENGGSTGTACLAAPAAGPMLPFMATGTPAIPPHKTAIRRCDLSRPMKSALQDGLIDPTVTVFDYGCGHGQDIALLTAQGIACDGWDPAFRPDAARCPADVVNLGFVLNVIEDVG